jgi:superfamily II DNA or RNA helicase
VATNPAPLHAGEVVRIRDERWRVVHRVAYDHATAIHTAGCDTDNRASHGTFLLPFETIERAEAHTAPRFVSRRRWRRGVRHSLATASPSWASLRAAARANLRIIPFQLEPVLALVRGEACRFLIADAVGLGKTVQAGLMIAETLARAPDGRTLIVAPASLREQWRHEIDSRFHLRPDVLDAAGVVRLTSRLPTGVNPWAMRPVVITSIDYVKRPEVLRSLETLIWDLIVFDEAHNLAGRSDRATAAGAIGHRARAVVLLTATPHSGDDQAFDRLCDIGRLGGTDRLHVFRRTRPDVGLPHTRRDTLLRIQATEAEIEMHRVLMLYAKRVWARSSETGGAGAQLAMSVLARRACSSAASLARSIERRLDLLGEPASMPETQPGLPFIGEVIEDEEPDASLRAPGLSDAQEERGHLLRVLDLARHAAMAQSKFAALRRLVVRADEPAIVFTEYRDTLQELPAMFSGLETVQLHGGLTARERTHALRRFTDGTARVLLATDAASEGLSLHQRCRLVINLELPWTPLRLEQRAGRVDRIGQTAKVHVIQFVAKGTYEETTLPRLADRITRIQDAMRLTHSTPNERQVAASILGGESIPDVIAAPVAVGTVWPADFRREAEVEAKSIACTRALIDPDTQRPPDDRGVITHLRRRTCRAPQAIWGFAVTLSSASGQVVWEPLITLTADLRHRTGRRRGDIRRDLRSDQPSVVQALRDGQDQALLELREALRRPLALWTCREQDVMTELHGCRARLAAGLTQGSLFDTRHERLTAAQSALLDEALSLSARRLRDLEALGSVEVESCRLVFAAVIE